MGKQEQRWSAMAAEVTCVAMRGVDDHVVTAVEYDSRRVAAGAVFVAMRGGSHDGNRFIAQVVAQGAAAVITDSPEAFAQMGLAHPQVSALLVEHGRKALAQVAAAFYGHPERAVAATGVTGTNGKTTTAFLLEALLAASGRRSVLVGTIEYHVAGEVRPSLHTTPESRDLFQLMAEGRERGATEMVMEVSSHALDQGRVECLPYDVAIFTNLTRDHLDYHQTMEAYFAAKRLLFDGTRYRAPRVAVIHIADAWAERMAAAAREAGAQVVTFGLHGDGAANDADWRAEELSLTSAGVAFRLVTPHGEARVNSPLAGAVNVLNLLGALAAVSARGVGFEALVAAIPQLRPVPGRFQPVDAGQPFSVIVDYAHTDDALRNLLALARAQAAPRGGRVLTMFGCGGDRDRTKRPKMGQAAGEGSDLVVVTSDNPRSEDAEAIVAEIVPAVAATGTRFEVVVDRAAAIARIVALAQPNDVVLLAGKGHEKVQILADHTIAFDDAEVALSALRRLGYGEGACN